MSDDAEVDVERFDDGHGQIFGHDEAVDLLAAGAVADDDLHLESAQEAGVPDFEAVGAVFDLKKKLFSISWWPGQLLTCPVKGHLVRLAQNRMERNRHLVSRSRRADRQFLIFVNQVKFLGYTLC